jgi:hypothetical protein
MKSLPQSHFDRTGWWSHGLVWLAFLAGLGFVLALNAERLVAASNVAKGAIAFAVLIVLAWPRHILGGLVCEIVRECTRARCPKCGGPAKAYLDPDQAPSYICQSCGHQVPIKVPVISSRFDFSGGHDGGGGGGG